MAEVGALASVIGIAGAGAKLAIAIFEFASSIGSAGSEIMSVGTEISQFCAVVKQIESALRKAKKTVRYSLTALLAIESIVDRCQNTFKEIENILDGLRRGKAEIKILGRLIWPVKRVRVEMLRKSLESSKLTLSCMLMTLLFAENIASRSTSAEDTQKEDEDQQAVNRSLIIAEQCSVGQLERLEEEFFQHEAEQASSADATFFSTSLDSRPAAQHHPSGLMDGETPSSHPYTENQNQLRNSIFLNNVMSGDLSSTTHGQSSQKGLTSSFTASRPIDLLKKWTDEGNRLSRLVEGSHVDKYDENQKSQNVLETRESFYENEDTVGFQNNRRLQQLFLSGSKDTNFQSNQGSTVGPNFLSPIPQVQDDAIDPRKKSIYNHRKSKSTGQRDENMIAKTENIITNRDDEYTPNSVLGAEFIFQKVLVKAEDSRDSVLAKAMDMYHLQGDPALYSLWILYDDHERELNPADKPRVLHAQLVKKGLKPEFMLRKRANNLTWL